MDEETSIISNNTRNEKIKNFFIRNKSLIILIISLSIIILIGYFVFDEYKERRNVKISDQYNSIIVEY